MKLLGGQLARNNDPDALVRGHVGLYGAATATDELMRAAKAAADEHGAILTQHQSFYADDVADDDERFGGHPLAHFAEIGVLGPNCTFSHMNAIRDDETQAVTDSGLTMVWMPGNYMFYGIAEFFQQRTAELYHLGVAGRARLRRRQGVGVRRAGLPRLPAGPGARPVPGRRGHHGHGQPVRGPRGRTAGPARAASRRACWPTSCPVGRAAESHPPGQPGPRHRADRPDQGRRHGHRRRPGRAPRHGHATLVDDEEVFSLADASAKRWPPASRCRPPRSGPRRRT